MSLCLTPQGFVKIARWNDINYYAVKQAAERTHKTLHKHMKDFETKLKQPVQALLTEDVKPDWSTASQNEAESGDVKVLDAAMFVETTQVCYNLRLKCDPHLAIAESIMRCLVQITS
jgi:hypothetical protein